MATWKKVLVSGSNISELVNDLNYISNHQSGVTLTGSFSGSFVGDGSGLTNLPTGANPILNVDGITGSATVDLGTQILTISGSNGITTSASGQNVTISGINATTTTRGVASFNSSFFTVSNGAVSISSGSITDTQLNTSVAGTGLLGGGGTPLSVDYGSTSGKAVEGNTNFTLTGTANQILVDSSSSPVAQALGGTPAFTLSLPSQLNLTGVNISNDLVVSGDITVMGTASFQHTTNLEVADRFVLFASGSNSTGDGGFVVQQATQDVGEVFGWDSVTQRWGVDTVFNASTSDLAPEAFAALSILGGDDPNDTDAPDPRYDVKGNIFISTGEAIWIYS